MIFVPNLCTVKTYMVTAKSDRNLHKYGINWCNMHNLNLNLLDQRGPKTKNLFIENFLKNYVP